MNDYRAANWVKDNERKREQHRKRMEDPDYAAKQRAYWKDYYQKRKDDPKYREARALASRVYRMKNGAKVRDGGAISEADTGHYRLPIAPFKAWLIEMTVVKGVQKATLARDAGKDERTIRRILSDDTQRTVRLDYVDALVTGQGYHLWELYPDLYDS